MNIKKIKVVRRYKGVSYASDHISLIKNNDETPKELVNENILKKKGIPQQKK